MTMAAEPAGFVLKALVSFLIGALIGLERERARASTATKRLKELPGVRSFGLLSLYGFLVAYVSGFPHPYSLIYVALLCALVGIIACSYAYYRTVKLGLGGVTTYIVLALSFTLGVMIGYDYIVEATAVGVLTALVLASKPYIERGVQALTYKELLALLEVATIAFVVGPLVYNLKVAGISVWPIYVFFLAILATSFASYVAIKVRGERGARYVALCGGLVNSEAVVASFAALVREGSLPREELRSALILSCTGMYVRNAVLALAMLLALYGWSFKAMLPVAELLLVGAIPFAVLSIKGWRAWIRGEAPIKIESPISWGVAIKSASFYALVAAGSAVLLKSLGVEGLSLAAVAGGFVSAAATILSLYTAASLLNLPVLVYAKIALLASAAALANKAFYVYLGSKEAKLSVESALMLAPLTAFLLALALIPL